ncbi:TrpB-like pyridoxal phosphate-dependent enzyme [Streptomyces sp. NPDC059698]|uniref:TrpB-like pyridoxal phosphate-dependent enzyme n=1 Tax=unclassified Streptomyces TaxID=2593676 RepID=UPI00093F5E47|nr:TrpB-like pyridoxal phosphate-dependent enzyme [Streptomyces sp. CB02366]OKJ28018.1 tryptophan synthase beta chain [Streptomyces sp. CB02366]TVP35676.1 TrpB-like pyridoxal-phosphate dependent enzyme [Streptomyces griseus subsp. griseus]WSS58889.1 TrpB-like pyridoxal phosphate-dependent enzyme [Streptomyces sp. NBC_01178]
MPTTGDVYPLDRDQVPTHWYSVGADLPFEIPAPQPPPRPEGAADGPRNLRPQLPLSLYRQGTGTQRYVEIPEAVRREYQRWRPTPLYRATQLERELETPAHIYFKFEGTSPSGSHKINTALPQAYYYSRSGVTELVTGTGAGQWGSALAMASHPYGMDTTVFMVRSSYEQKPYRGTLMRLYGARVVKSPSDLTEVGRAALRENPDHPGSLGIANAEAIEYASTRPAARFSVGSGESHVLLHQTVIGEEALLQMGVAGEFPDVVIGAMGAGSNFAGITFPFYREGLTEDSRLRFVAVEPEACPKMTRGRYLLDYTDFSGVTPRSKMYTLGHKFAAYPIHAGGLRYHGAAPIVSAMYDNKLIEAVAYAQTRVFEAGRTFAKAEGIIPAPESAHAIARAIDEAVEARRQRRKSVILFSLSGHGLLDLGAYDQFLAGDMIDSRPSDEEIQDSIASVL